MNICFIFFMFLYNFWRCKGDRHHHHPPKQVEIISIYPDVVDTYSPIKGNKTSTIHRMPPSGNLTCNDLPCPEERGICNINDRCICFKPYYSMKDYDTYGMYQCNYDRKSQMIAFFLEFIISFGIGHYYLGNFMIGFIKSFFCAISVSVFLVMPYLSIKHRNKKMMIVTPYAQLFITVAFCIWQILDSILFGINFYVDSNGVLPESW